MVKVRKIKNFTTRPLGGSADPARIVTAYPLRGGLNLKIDTLRGLEEMLSCWLLRKGWKKCRGGLDDDYYRSS